MELSKLELPGFPKLGKYVTYMTEDYIKLRIPIEDSYFINPDTTDFEAMFDHWETEHETVSFNLLSCTPEIIDSYIRVVFYFSEAAKNYIRVMYAKR